MGVAIGAREVFNNSDINNPDIDGGTVDGATIATSNITVGAGKTLDVSAGTVTLANDQISGDKVEGGTIAATTITTLTSTTINMADAGKIIHDIAPASDHTCSGPSAFTATAGENLVYGDVCYLKSDGKYWKIDADAIATMPAQVMATATIAADATGTFLEDGWARDDSWSWTIGGLVYGSTTGGGLTQTAPSGEFDVIQVVGVAITATVIKFKPSWIMVEVGLDLVDVGTATPTTITMAELSSQPKNFLADHSSDQTFNLAAPSAADAGKEFRLIKDGTGAGHVILQLPTGVSCDGGTAAGTVTLEASARGAVHFLIVSATQIEIVAAKGTYTIS